MAAGDTVLHAEWKADDNITYEVTTTQGTSETPAEHQARFDVALALMKAAHPPA